MRLRTQIQESLQAIVSAEFPGLVETIWGGETLVVAIEQMQFAPASGFEGDWERKSTVMGTVRTELHTDKLDAYEFEPLIPALVKGPVTIRLPGLDERQPDKGEVWGAGRLTFVEWRDAIRDTDVVAALRFQMDAVLYAYDPEPANPGTNVVGLRP